MIILGILLAALVIIAGYLYLHIVMAAIMTHETMFKLVEMDDEITKLAKDVIRGKYGNSQARKENLGDKYTEVQARVNELLER